MTSAPKPADVWAPNVLLLVTDDQGAWALGSQMPELHTPTLDRLQREGTTLASFFCASPVCSPARASIMTGRMPSAHGVHDWIVPEALARGSSPQRRYDPEFLDAMTGADSIAAMLSRHGYRCGMVGKWHVGSSDRPAEGFDYWYAHQLGGGPYYGAPIWHQDEVTGLPKDPAEPGQEHEYVTDAITRQSVDFLRRIDAAPERRPFFLQVNWTAPHDPWFDGNHPDDLLDVYADTDFPSVPETAPHPWFVRENFPRALADRRGALAGYCAAISGVDRSISSLLDHLERSGELENTIVIFTSDNGFSCGHHGIWGKGNATAPLNFWEPSITVPFIASWPGRILSGVVDKRPASATSILETIADLTGAEPLDDPLRAGRSVASRLLGRGADAPASSSTKLSREGEEGRSALLRGEEPIVVHDEYGANRMIRTDRWKFVTRRSGPSELYDLRDDPLEMYNLSDDPAHSARMRVLSKALDEWFTDHETSELSGWHTSVDGTGQVEPLV